jgi:MFS family permease
MFSALDRVLPARGAPRLLGHAALASAIGRSAFAACAAIYFTHVIGLSVGEFGLGLTIAGAFGLVAGVPFGHLADRRGPREVTVVLVVLTGFAAASFVLAKSFWTFTACACAFALFERGSFAARQATLAAAVSNDQIVPTRAFLRSIGNIGVAMGAGAAGIAIGFDFRPLYLGTIALSSIAFFVSAWVVHRLPKKPTIATVTRSSGLAAVRDVPYGAVTLANAVVMFHAKVLDVALPLWVVQFTDAPRPTAAAMVILNTTCVILFQVRLARKVDTVDAAVRTTWIAGISLFVACVLFAVAAYTSSILTLVLLAAATLIHVYSEMVHSAASWVLSFDLAPPGMHGQYQGLFNSGFGLAQMIAPVVLVFLVIQWGPPGWLVIGALFAIAGAATAPAVRWSLRSRAGAGAH